MSYIVSPYLGVDDTFSLSYVDSAASSSDLTTYTFASLDLGDVASTRLISVGATSRGTSAARTVVSLSVGGTALAQIDPGVTNDEMSLEWWQVLLPNGLTGNVVVQWSGACESCAVVVYRLTGANAVPTDTSVSTADDPTVSQDVVAGGGCAAFAATNPDLGTASEAWVGLTEDGGANVDFRYTSASDVFASTQTGLTVTCNFTNLEDSVMSVISWQAA